MLVKKRREELLLRRKIGRCKGGARSPWPPTRSVPSSRKDASVTVSQYSANHCCQRGVIYHHKRGARLVLAHLLLFVTSFICKDKFTVSFHLRDGHTLCKCLYSKGISKSNEIISKMFVAKVTSQSCPIFLLMYILLC